MTEAGLLILTLRFEVNYLMDERQLVCNPRGEGGGGALARLETAFVPF